MKNLFSNILNKKHKEINKKEKVELKVNEMKEKTNETRQLPTGQAIDYLNKSTIIQDYKGNIIAEYLRIIYIPGKGLWRVDPFERTLFDEYHVKRDLIPKPRLYLFDKIESQSNIKSNVVNPIISKNNILLDNDVIEFNFKRKQIDNDEVSWKKYFKRQIYVQNKSNYENLIQNLFKDKMKKIKYSPQNDFYAQNGRFSSYFFHYTDVESALSILIDGYIYPHKKDQYSKNKKFVHLNRDYDFNDYRTGKDVDLIRKVYNFSYGYGSCYSNPKVEKLQYAFGFKSKDLKEKRMKYENHIYRYNKRINLKNKEFILIIRNYTF
jgi:hypothetical protein